MSSPFLKWAGGKRWLVSSGRLHLPTHFNTYVEPFLGSGAVFFHLKPKKALLSDSNKSLIELYSVIKSRPDEFERKMRVHQRKHSAEYYYTMRERQPSDPVEAAARFLYLNRTCWNGLYRVNAKGIFNVPIGTKQTVVFETDNFEEVSRTLKRAKLVCCDFEKTIDKCKKGDFLFVDPPYTAQHNMNGFLKYNEKIFSWNDQIRLRSSLERAKDRGVAMAITNADHESIHNLYDGFGWYQKLERHSKLAGDAKSRVPTTEALFLVNIKP